MPPLIVLALAGAGVYAGYRLFSKLIEQAQTPAKPAGKSKSDGGEPKNLGGLEWDEKIGAYRPKKSA
ncbi:MAG: hypothetical protein ABL907_19340 [Hyphomicrobium sp.]